ncbi:unnamed protein product [Orchesella dallaii]|uniref:Knottin scorpion toxin-like domain-containing protein n=1 Tax=Orchesella dallaii TaxID=48710 RepID=A0ABP1RIC8_9HEXA
MACHPERKTTQLKKVIATVLALSIVATILTICEGATTPPTARLLGQGECWPKMAGHSQSFCTSSDSCSSICKGDGNAGGYCSWLKCYCHGCP